MAVEVRLPTLLRAHADGAATVSAEGATVGEVFTDLVAKYPGMAGNLIDEQGYELVVDRILQWIDTQLHATAKRALIGIEYINAGS